MAVTSVLYPCESDSDSPRAFAHALRIATALRAEFCVLQATGDTRDVRNWRTSPGVRAKLEQWGLLPRNSPQADVAKVLGLRVAKRTFEGLAPADAITAYCDEHVVDAIVLGTEGRRGLPRWLQPSRAESVARRLKVPTLFVPVGARGFVDDDTGAVRLERVLIPVDAKPDPSPAIETTLRLLATLGVQSSRITVLHVGSSEDPVPSFPSSTGRFEMVGITREGVPAQAIVEAARERESSVIVMATEGRRGIFDVIRGSTSERVLREAPCPVLTVPSA